MIAKAHFLLVLSTPTHRDGQALPSSCYDENMSDDDDMKKGGSKQTTEAK